MTKRTDLFKPQTVNSKHHQHWYTHAQNLLPLNVYFVAIHRHGIASWRKNATHIQGCGRVKGCVHAANLHPCSPRVYQHSSQRLQYCCAMGVVIFSPVLLPISRPPLIIFHHLQLEVFLTYALLAACGRRDGRMTISAFHREITCLPCKKQKSIPMLI